jgi:TonB family protein
MNWGNAGSSIVLSKLLLTCIWAVLQTSVAAMAADAQPLPERQSPPPIATAPQETQVVPRPNDCNLRLPTHLRFYIPQAVVLLKVRLDEHGIMHEPTLLRSSGNGSFDQSVLTCANSNSAFIAHSDGKPTETTAVMGYYISFGGSGFVPALADGSTPACKYPFRLLRTHPSGIVHFSFHIGIDGKTGDIKLARSSGNAEIDQIVLDCTRSWTFFPFTRDNRPAAIEVGHAINFGPWYY